jgi:hypothetical protein
MRLWTRVIATLGLAATIPVITLAGPQGGHGYAGSGPISGPAPLGASGPAPMHASGNLIGTPYRGSASAGNVNRGRNNGPNRNPGGAHNGGTHNGGRGDSRRYSAPIFYTPFYDSFADYGSTPYDSGYYGGDPGPDPGLQNMVQTQEQLSDQVQRLSGEIQQLRENRAPSPPSDEQAGNDSEAAQNRQPPPVPVTLVLHSGQKLQIQNYAVMDGIFWDFSRQPARKIPLSQIDVAASAKLTQDNGGEFPNLNEGNQADN